MPNDLLQDLGEILTVNDGSGSVEYTAANQYINVNNSNHTISGYDWSNSISNKASTDYVDTKTDTLGERITAVDDKINDEVEDRENADTDLSNRIDNKQDKLTAGDNITINYAGAVYKEITSTTYPISFTSNGSELTDYSLYGILLQDGTPSLTDAKPILGVGPTININRNSALANTISLTDPLYVMNNNTEYVSYSEQKVHKFTKFMDLSLLSWTGELSSGKYRFWCVLPNYTPSVGAGRDPVVKLNRFYYNTQDAYGVGFGHSNGRLYIYVDESIQTVDQLMNWLSSNYSYVVYPTAEYTIDVTVPKVYTENGSNSFTFGPRNPSQTYIKYVESSSNELVISGRNWNNELEEKQDKLSDQEMGNIDYIPVLVQDVNDLEQNKQDKFSTDQLSAISSISSMYNMITAISAQISATWTIQQGNGITITNDETNKISTISLSV